MSDTPRSPTIGREQVLARLADLQTTADESADWGALRAEVAELYESLDEQTRSFKRQRHQYNTVVETMREIALKTLDIHRFEQYTLNTLRGQFGVLNVYFFRQHAYGDTQIAVHTARLKNPPALQVDIEGEFGKFLARHIEPLVLDAPPDDVSGLSEIDTLRGLGMAVALPLVKRDEVGDQALMGMIGLGPRLGNLPYGPADREFLGLLGSMIGVTLYNAHLYQRSIIDNLTQVFSRGHFDIHLDQELARVERFNEQVEATGVGARTGVMLVMLDIDHFKQFNDRYGHQVGDWVLQHVAHALKQSSRAMDIVCRYGGEEFGVIFPDVVPDKAMLIAERMRKAVESSKINTPSHGELSVTISVGVAIYPFDAPDPRTLIARADAALYEAKRAGRNRVVLAAPTGPIHSPQPAG